MSSRTPGASTAFPSGQLRQGFGRNWGNYASGATLPNASGNALTTAHFSLEQGDCAWVTGDGMWECVSPGTAGGSDALWARAQVGPGNVLYVDQLLGNDNTGARGWYSRPFATIQAALNLMQTDDVVQLAPQQFDLSASLTIPASVIRGSMRGWGASLGNSLSGWWGEGQTILHGVNSTIIIDFGANLGLARFSVADMDFWNDDTTTVISAEGTLYAQDTYMQEGGVQFVGCSIVGGVVAKYATLSFVDCVDAVSSAYVFTNCYTVDFLHHTSQSGSIVYTFDPTDPQSPSTPGFLRVREGSAIGGAGTASFVELGGTARFLLDATSVIGGLRGNNLAVSAGYAPWIVCAGGIGAANVAVFDFYSSAARQLPDSAIAGLYDFRGCRFFQTNGGNPIVGGPSTIGFQVAGAAANRQTILMDLCEALPDTTLIAGNGVSISAKSALLPSVVATISGTGTINRGQTRSFDLNAPSTTGTAPLVVGAVYLTATLVLQTSSNALVGTAGGGTGTLQLRRNGTGVLVPGASWAFTGVGLSNASLAAAVTISVTDWYTVELVGDAAPTVALAYGLRLDY